VSQAHAYCLASACLIVKDFSDNAGGAARCHAVRVVRTGPAPGHTEQNGQAKHHGIQKMQFQASIAQHTVGLALGCCNSESYTRVSRLLRRWTNNAGFPPQEQSLFPLPPPTPPRPFHMSTLGTGRRAGAASLPIQRHLLRLGSRLLKRTPRPLFARMLVRRGAGALPAALWSMRSASN
jgi:hypothetical protein